MRQQLFSVFFLALAAVFTPPLYSAQMGGRDVSTLSFAERLAIAQKRSLLDRSNNSRQSSAAHTSSIRAGRGKKQPSSTRRTTQSQQPRFTEDDLEDYSWQQSPTAYTSSSRAVRDKKPKSTEEQLLDYFTLAAPYIAEAKDQKLAMFLGRTGAGKSTLVNALMGHKLKWETIEIPPTENALRRSRKLGIPLKKQTEKKLNLVLNRNIASFAEVGHGAVSETTYPACYSIDEEDYMSCDCPGLGDTRGTAKEFCVALSTRVAIEQAQHVQAVVFVIPYASIQKDRSIASGAFTPVIAALKNLFPKGFKRHNKSIFFVFTKAPKETNILDCSQLLEWHLAEAKGTYAEILEALTEGEIRSLVFDPVDGGKSLREIREALRKSEPIPTSVFGFAGGDKLQGALRRLFDKYAQKGIALLANFKNCQKNISDIKNTLQEISLIKRKVFLGSLRLADLDTDEKHFHKRLEYDEKEAYHSVNKGVVNTHLFTYNDLPFVEVKKHYSNGYFSDIDSSPEIGCYIATYSTPSDTYGSAVLDFYVAQRTIFQDKIKEINWEIKKQKMDLAAKGEEDELKGDLAVQTALLKESKAEFLRRVPFFNMMIVSKNFVGIRSRDLSKFYELYAEYDAEESDGEEEDVIENLFGLLQLISSVSNGDEKEDDDNEEKVDCRVQ